MKTGNAMPPRCVRSKINMASRRLPGAFAPVGTHGDPLTDVMSPHPYPGATMLIYESGPLWGEPSGLFTAWVKGPRWLDLWTAGEEILARCGDKTYIFIEGFARLPGNPNTLEMQNGS